MGVDGYTAAYARTSSAHQKDRASIDTQIQAIDLAAHLAQDPVSLWYKDDGVSGRSVPTAERPDGRRLLADVQAGKIKRLYVYKISRLGRDHEDGEAVLAMMRRSGVELVSLAEGAADLKSNQGKFLASLHSLLADYQATDQLSHANDGMQRVANAGGFLGGLSPYGYRTEGEGKTKRLIIDRDRIEGVGLSPAEVVVLIFEWAAEGMSLKSICHRLNQQAIPSPGLARQRKKAAPFWSTSVVHRIIGNTTYRGQRSWGGSQRSNYHTDAVTKDVPAIIDTELWAFANEQIAKKRPIADPDAPHRDFPLGGLVGCGDPECGAAYSGRRAWRPSGWSQSYYRCSGRYRTRQGHDAGHPRTSCPTVKADKIEATIWSVVRAVLEGDEAMIQRTIDRVIAERSGVLDGAEATMLTLSAERQELNDRRVALIDSLTRKLINDDDFLLFRAKLDEEGRSLVRREEQARAHAGAARALSDDVAAFRRRVAEVRAGWQSGGEADWVRVRKLVARLNVVMMGDRLGVEIIWRHGSGQTVELEGGSDIQHALPYSTPLPLRTIVPIAA